MNEKELRCIEYTAIRFNSGFGYRNENELIKANLISNYKDIYLDSIKEISRHKDFQLLSSSTQCAINKVLNKQGIIKDSIAYYLDSINKYGIKVVSEDDEYYPMVWREFSGLPKVFFARGNLELLKDCNIHGSAAIVGSRTPSRYALYATKQFSKDLANKDIVIVSGGAIGIDREAHESTLECNGKTILVSPCGPDMVYPYRNKDIFEKIYRRGLVITEMPPGQKVIKQYFPARNRLISALSDVCLVMEAGLFSGTLHTASSSATYGKDVFVLPNNIYVENSHGGLKLLKDGAEVLIESKEVIDKVASRVFDRLSDIIYKEKIEQRDSKADIRNRYLSCPESLTDEEWKELICDEISVKPMTLDELLNTINIPFSFLSILISELEITGKIENSAGKYFLTL